MTKSDSTKKYEVTVRNFPFVSSEYCDKYATKESKSAMNGLCRPNHSIVETDMEETFPIERLLPAVVKLEQPNFFTRKNEIPPETLVPGTYRVFFCPLGFLDPMKSFERRSLDQYVRDDDELPASLLRGLNKVSDEKRQMLEKRYKEEIFPVREKARFIGVSSDPLPSPIPVVTKRTKVGTKNEKKKETKPKTSNTKNTGNKRKLNTLESRCPSKRRRSDRDLDDVVCIDKPATTASTSASTVESEIHATLAQIFPNKPLYVLRPKNKKGTATAARHFFESVELNLCKQNYDSCIRNRISGKFTFHVGDVVAISSNNQAAPHRTKYPWMPFTVPWVVAQVLTVYRKDRSASSQVFVDCRCMYRLSDVDLFEELQLTDTERRCLFESRFSTKMVIEVDEFVDTIPVEAVLGKVDITSDPKPSAKWLNRFVDDGKNPQVPLICRHLYQSKILATSLDEISDWTEFRKRIAGPLSRGLLCEKAHAGKDQTLQLKYLNAIKSRLGISGEIDGGLSDRSQYAESRENDVPARWPLELMNVEAYSDDSCLTIYTESTSKGSSVDFLSSALIPFVPRRLVSRAIGKKNSAAYGQCWRVKVGDIVCVAWDMATVPRAQSTKNPWYPFAAPWRIGQVTCIYKKSKDQNSGSSEPLLELRMFNRRCEMPANTLSWMPPQTRDPIPEIFETNSFERDVKASRVLGSVELFVAHHIKKACYQLDCDIPAVEFRCKYLFLTSFCHFQPLFSGSPSPEGWFHSMMMRAFRFSPFIQERTALFCALRDRCQRNKVCPLSLTESSYTMQREDSPEKVALCRQVDNHSERRFFFSLTLTPPWGNYALSDALFPETDRKGLVWVARVGDIVAVQSSHSTVKSCDFPYSVQWKAAQIVSIFQNMESGSCTYDSEFKVEVRWLFREEVTSSSAAAQTGGLGILYEYADGCTDKADILESDSLLGPIVMFSTGVSELQQNDRELLWSNVETHSHLPVSVHLYGGKFDARVGVHIGNSQTNSHRMRTLLRRCIEKSTQYNKESIEEIFAEVMEALTEVSKVPGRMQPHIQLNYARHNDDNQSISESSSVRLFESDAWLSKPPFHIDHSANWEFFQEACVRPRYGVFCRSLPTPSVPDDSVWRVQVGDVVIVRHSYTSGRTLFGNNGGLPHHSKNFPLADDVKWAVAEVVTIIKRPSTKDALKSLISFEIRWIYRSSEIKGIDLEKDSTGHLVEEVFESDHYDEISPCNLLSPVELVDKPKVSEAKYFMGMPVVQFQCCRFWSLHRRSLIPVGDLRGRIKRARVHSNFSKELDMLSSNEPENQPQYMLLSSTNSDGEWKESFRQVVKKLSLTDASTEGFENSAVLIGRQDDQQKIISFLRSSILGQGRDENRASYFVAGPPGVGKTASIRAAICDLKQEQTEGKIPRFDFVSLNGMEMRSPSEAYSKFLEKICKNRNNYSPEKARKELTKYFEKSDPRSDLQSPRIIVLLLDEIDYIVTPKEEIVYDFFTWPAISWTAKSPFRLVLIGISNTLNLLDRLHQRVQSRIGPNHLSFAAYNADQTVAILTAKILHASPHYKVFEQEAILFAAKKTAMASGDIRQAFHICRTAAELVLDHQEETMKEGQNPVVRVKDVVAAVQKSMSSAEFKRIAQCTPFEALLLISLAALRKSTGIVIGFDLEEIMSKMEQLAKSSGNEIYLPPPTLEETLGLVSRLADCQLVSVAMATKRLSSISFRSSISGCGGCWPMVYTDAEDTTLMMSLKSTPHSKLANKYLGVSSSK